MKNRLSTSENQVMKTSISFLSIICLSLLLSCSKLKSEKTKNTTSNKSEFREQSFTLSLNECKNISFNSDEIRLCLDSLSDSRCPTNATCVWAGTAIARFSFTKNEQTYPIVLATLPFLSYQQKTTVAGYTITLINVLPYPVVPPLGPLEPPTKAEIKISN